MNQRVHGSRTVSAPAALRRTVAAPTPIALKAMRAADVLALQSVAGNRAARSAQRSMNVGAAGDSFEKEADSVARDILSKGDAQRAPEEELQAKHVQREAEGAEAEEAELQAKHIQREAEGAEAEDEELQAKHVQRQAEDEELQAKHVQREAEGAEAEEEELQAKHVQRDAAPEVGMEGGSASAETSSAIEGARGGGQPLPDPVRREMEGHFGADFSGVRTHTDAQSADLNQRLSARAFTTGNDIFLGKEGLNAGSRGGKELLAHELTHVVQQGAARKLDRKPRRA